jgi:hypothetical protein
MRHHGYVPTRARVAENESSAHPEIDDNFIEPSPHAMPVLEHWPLDAARRRKCRLGDKPEACLAGTVAPSRLVAAA